MADRLRFSPDVVGFRHPGVCGPSMMTSPASFCRHGNGNPVAEIQRNMLQRLRQWHNMTAVNNNGNRLHSRAQQQLFLDVVDEKEYLLPKCCSFVDGVEENDDIKNKQMSMQLSLV